LCTSVKALKESSMNDNEYECASCHGVFEKGQSDEDAGKEQTENGWCSVPDGECDLICEDCYQKMIKTDPPVNFNERKKKMIEALTVLVKSQIMFLSSDEIMDFLRSIGVCLDCGRHLSGDERCACRTEE